MSAACRECDVAVVGAGPAGLAAAEAAARAGASVLCLDLFALPGGQYAMQPTQPGSPFTDSSQARSGRDAAERVRAAGGVFLAGAEVFWATRDADGGFVLSVNHAGSGLVVRARRVIAASGAMERALPFPGWTLPGVIGAAAAQRFLKTGSGRLPGHGRIVLAGTGPFLLAVGQTFRKAGQRVDHVVEMRRPGAVEVARLLLAHPDRIGETLRVVADVQRTGARQHRGWIVTRALGDERLRAVEIAPLGENGRPMTDKAMVIEGVGTLAIGYGFQPVIDLTASLSARHGFSMALGGWHCLADGDGQTSVPGLFAAGETLGMGGARPAALSGRIAGSVAAASLGHVPGELAATRAALVTARHFAAALAAIFPLPETLPLDLPDSEPVCRCEDVTIGQIRAAIAEGACETVAVKMWTRAGMGPCQGRICGAGLAAELRRAGVSAEAAGFNRPHLPLRPTPLDVVRTTADAVTRTAEPTAANTPTTRRPR